MRFFVDMGFYMGRMTVTAEFLMFSGGIEVEH